LGFQRTNGLRGKDNQIYRVTAMETDTPVFQPRGDALFNVSDSVLRGAENDITSLEEASSGAFTELINDGLPGRKYVVGLAANPNFKGGNVELFVARLEETPTEPYGAPEAYAVLTAVTSPARRSPFPVALGSSPTTGGDYRRRRSAGRRHPPSARAAGASAGASPCSPEAWSTPTTTPSPTSTTTEETT
jgi:hypothetical protein